MIFKETLIKSLSFAVKVSRFHTYAAHFSASPALFHTAGALSAPSGHLPLEGKAIPIKRRSRHLHSSFAQSFHSESVDGTPHGLILQERSLAMDHSQYLTSMGITLCRRALFSYTSQPQGSYGLHVIFRKFVKEKKILMHDRDRDNWCAFLSDYIVFRLYIAKYILKDYAKDYTPLLHIFEGIHQIEDAFPAFFREEADPGRAVGDQSFLPPDLDTRYRAEAMDHFYNIFNAVSTQMEEKPLERNQRLKSIITSCLTILSEKNHVPLYTPIFYFFSQETLRYAQFLADFCKGLIPDEFYEVMHAMPYQAVKKEEDPFYTSYHLPACIAIFVSLLLFFVLCEGGWTTSLR